MLTEPRDPDDAPADTELAVVRLTSRASDRDDSRLFLLDGQIGGRFRAAQDLNAAFLPCHR